jgi:hypothetical protein
VNEQLRPRRRVRKQRPLEERSPLPTRDADLLVGLQEIAAFLGCTKRIAHYRVEKGYVPATKHGRLITASKVKITTALTG